MGTPGKDGSEAESEMDYSDSDEVSDEADSDESEISSDEDELSEVVSSEWSDDDGPKKKKHSQPKEPKRPKKARKRSALSESEDEAPATAVGDQADPTQPSSTTRERPPPSADST